MTDFGITLDQIRQLLAQHIDPSTVSKAVPIAGGLLLIGLLISVFGAKFARLGITSVFVLAGIMAGRDFGIDCGFQPLLCGLIGAVALGVISFLTFRLWVGLVTGLVCASVALGAFSYQRVLPHAREFNPTPMAQRDASASSASFSLPSPDAQNEYLGRSPSQYFGELRDFVSQRDNRAERDGRVIGVIALLGGTLLGVLAVRFTSILATSVLGTFLVASATISLLANWMPTTYQSVGQHPTMAGVGLGACLVTSLIIQYLLTRKAAQPKG